MSTPLQRIRRGVLVLAIVFMVAVCSFRAAGYPWLEAIWFFIISISGVGYSERSTEPPLIQFLTVGLIVFGMSAAVYTFGGFLEMVVEGEMDRLLGHRRTAREIDKLTGHVILCGFGRIGQILAAELERSKLAFVVIENEPKHAAEARAREFLLIEADATDDEVLLRAGITRAKTLVTGVPSDAANVFITLTGRNLNPGIHIVARAEHATSERKLLQAGANKVVMPAATGARQMARMITRPSTADLMALVSDSGNFDIELDEFLVTETSHLGGVTVRESEAHRKYRLLVVAVKQASGDMVFNPEADFRFQNGDIVILMGRAVDIRQFRAEHHT